MGEVYRARDTRLDRTVAIKILPAALSGDDHARQRFEREARSISSLNHPHICTLHDIGHADGTDYLVLEYLEGETLEKQLEKGPIPTEQLLRYATQIADALEKAHRAGIIHRDLKPGNIMLTKSVAKVLDFGLAKATPANAAMALATEGSRSLTAEGAIVGTFQYMAPEQLEGKEADARTDIFAFGAVLYEMATGKKAFRGKSQASLIASILASEPQPIATLAPMTPPSLERAVKKCLEKDPDDRWQTAHDLRDELKWIGESSSAVAAGRATVAGKKNTERAAWAIAGIMTLLAIAFGAHYFRRPTSEVHLVRSSILPPEKVTFSFSGPRGGPAALSPDGQTIAFTATSADGKDLLWIRSLTKIAAQLLPGTEGAAFPFWSPDGQFVGFFANGKLKKIEIASGSVQTISDAAQGRGGTWNREGTIVFAPNPRGLLFRVPASGGSAIPATTLADPSQTTQRWPWFLPDGKHFLYLAGNLAGSQGQSVYVASLDSKENKLILHANSNALYAQGYLLFLRERTLMAQRFDLKQLQLVGDSTAIAEDINGWKPIRSAFFSASDNGVITYQTGEAGAASQLSWFNRQGTLVSSLGESLPYLNLRLSSDQARLAVVIEEPAVNIWLYDLSRGVKTRFTSDLGPDTNPVWSPDGSRIIFASGRKGPFVLYQKLVNGSGDEEILFESGGNTKLPTDWSADGHFVAFEQSDPSTNTQSDIWILPMFGERKPFAFATSQFDERGAQFSPNGKWIAYTSDESGQTEIYVAPFPGPGTKWRVSTAGGAQPKWRRDGKELFFLAADKKLMAAEVKESAAKFEIGSIRPLFSIHARAIFSASVYDVSADGQRFLVNTLGSENLQPLTLVTNWTADLKK